MSGGNCKTRKTIPLLLFLLSYLLLLIFREQNIVLSDHVLFEIILLLSKILMYEFFFCKDRSSDTAFL
jgi:hypothetical protein